MKIMTLDGNAATSHVAYAFTEIALVYPITPSSPMAELTDQWQAQGRKNLFGQVPKIVQMQSEAGVAGAIHGAVTCGGLTTSYTSSQGLLLMIPNLYKLAGEFLPCVIHVSARAIATHALNIFGDHQDVMATRQTGVALLASSSVQECADFALIAHLASLKVSLPFLHFFDGFRTSHEVNKIEMLEQEEMQSLLDEESITAFRKRALDPSHPVCRGTTQNTDVYFQNRETGNNVYHTIPNAVQEIMDKVAEITKRHHHVFDYFGDSHAEHVIVVMGSAASTVEEMVEKLRIEGKRVGLIKVRLYRPFDGKRFCEALPNDCKRIAVLDRTKEDGSVGEPLYMDVCASLKEYEKTQLEVYGGRYGLGGKEFTPTMVCAVFKNLEMAQPKNHFTVGIYDDVSHTSLNLEEDFQLVHKDCKECKFYGLGSDGTVGANKNSIKIIGNQTSLFVQGYFCYDSKKSGGVTISHLRFGPKVIHSAYLIQHPDFVACHNPSYLEKYDMLSDCKEEGIFLLNYPWTNLEALNAHLPPSIKKSIAKKRLVFYIIDATKIANQVGLNGRTSTIMQAAFFLLNQDIMPYTQAKRALKKELENTFLIKGEEIVEKNFVALEETEKALNQIFYPASWQNEEEFRKESEPKDCYFQNFIKPILSLNGDMLPTSAFQADGSVPTGTMPLEKRDPPFLLPKWIKENCIQCNQCSFVCPHAAIRPFLLEEILEAPQGFERIPAMGLDKTSYRIQVSPHGCMGCGVCANVCPAKEKALVMTPSKELMPETAKHWEYARQLPPIHPERFQRNTIKGSQFFQPLFEFSYACAGCGETPYIKILTQLFGERMVIANATGCSSIYGGSAPTCPYTVNEHGHGPAWANSLFEDNAEFGLGMHLAYEARGIQDKSVWIIGGDGWAYDIGFGGLDHVLASGRNVNVLVLDSEVYSNTGGQSSKATPLGAVARFSIQGKQTKKKNLGLMAMTYGYVYVAQVSMGANKQQFLNAFIEAEKYDGPSLIIAYSPCIAHGMHMSKCMEEERKAVESGYWPLYRFNPSKINQGETPFTLDSKAPMFALNEFFMGENRFAFLKKDQPQQADQLFAEAEKESRRRLDFYKKLQTLFEDLS